MQYEHLTVTIPARADPNCWYRDVLGYKFRGFFRDHFQNDPEHTCLFQCLCVPHHFLSSVCGSALDQIASVQCCGLGCYSDVPETGIPAVTIALAVGAISSPPSIFTASIPPSCMNRPAFRI